MLDIADEANKIIIFGSESSWKSSILNFIAGNNNLFGITQQNNTKPLDKKFLMEKYMIDEVEYDLYDTIGISPSTQIKDLKSKLVKFKTTFLNEGYKLILITFPIIDSAISFSNFELLMSTFSFSNNQNVYVVFTQGDLFESEMKAEEAYLTATERIKKEVREAKYVFNPKNIFIYDSDHKYQMRKDILRITKDMNRSPTYITINDKTDFDDNMLLKLYKSQEVNEDKEIDDDKGGFLESITRFLSQSGFFNTPNMVM